MKCASPCVNEVQQAVSAQAVDRADAIKCLLQDWRLSLSDPSTVSAPCIDVFQMTTASPLKMPIELRMAPIAGRWDQVNRAIWDNELGKQGAWKLLCIELSRALSTCSHRNTCFDDLRLFFGSQSSERAVVKRMCNLDL